MKRLACATLILGALALSQAPREASAKDLDALTTRVRLMMDDQGPNGLRYSTATLVALLNDAQDITARESKCLLGTQYLTTTASVSSYTLTSKILNIERCSYWISGTTDTYKQLERYTLLGFNEYTTSWENTTTGLPTKYAQWGNQVILIPPPSAAYAGANKVRVDCVLLPTAMSVSTDVPFNDHYHLYPYHEMLAWYAAWYLKWREHDPYMSDSAKRNYDFLLLKMVNELYDRPDWAPKITIEVPGYSK